MTTLIITAAIGVGVAALVAFAASLAAPHHGASSAEDRLADLAKKGGRGKAGDDSRSLLLGGSLDDHQQMLDKLAQCVPRLGLLLEQADMRMKPGVFMLIEAVLLVGGTIAAALLPIPILLAPLIGLVLAGGALYGIMFKRKRRLDKFGRQLPEALELLGRSLRAGHSLAAGFGLVGSEMKEPLAREFRRVYEEQNLGIPLEEGLQDMADRMPNMDLQFFTTAIILQRSTGGDLAEILDKIGHLIRERLKILGQVNALTGEGRMSGYVLLAMPPALFLMMLYINQEYVMLLFTDPIGKYLVGGAIVSQIIGALVIKKIITIKV